MKISFLTSLRTPYRTLQVNEFSTINGLTFHMYYTNKQKENRNWDLSRERMFEETDLEGYGLFGKYGYINKGLKSIIKNSDLIILGGYEQPTYILMSLLCRIYNKPYILLFDGISSDRLTHNEQIIKKSLKSIVVKKAVAMLANGTVSRRYFTEKFQYPDERIYNQYLTVDYQTIDDLYNDKSNIRETYRKQLGINDSDKVILYSGRLLDFKNVKSVVKAISKLDKQNIVLLITGGGDEEEEIKSLANELNVKVIITGFITDQTVLFKHYFAADAFTLPSFIEPWGLVVNEVMIAGLPVMLSKNCGSSLDLVTEDNGKLFDPHNIANMAEVFDHILFKSDLTSMSQASRDLISEWRVENSRKNLESIIKKYISDNDTKALHREYKIMKEL